MEEEEKRRERQNGGRGADLDNSAPRRGMSAMWVRLAVKNPAASSSQLFCNCD